MDNATREGRASSEGAAAGEASAAPALSEAVRLAAGRVADELNNPLTNLSSRLELMLAEAQDRTGQAGLVDDLRTLQRNTERLVQLLEALRSYSGTGPACIRSVRLNDVVARAHASARVSGVMLALDPGDPWILGDGAGLERFVRQVLVDACRSPQDEGGVRVETTALARNPYQVVLVIRGVGGVADLAESSRRLLAEHPGSVDIRPIDDGLALTFPRLTLRLPGLPPDDVRAPDSADHRRADGERAEEFERVVRAVTESFDVSELAQRFTACALPLFPAYSAVAWLQQPDGSLECAAVASREPVAVGIGDVLPPRVGLAGRAVVERRVVWGPDVLHAAGSLGADEAPRDVLGAGQRAVAVPLIVKGEVIGAIVTEHAEPSGLIQGTIDRVRAFADQIAPAMRNVQLFARAQAAHAEAEAANRAKAEFLALVAHEVRNSLAPIVTSAAVIRQAAPADGVVQNSADIVKRQAQHLGQLLDDLRDVSGIALGRIELKRQRLSLTAAVLEVVESIRSLADPAGLRVSLWLSAAPLWIEADPTRLKQIIENLLINAVRYTPAGGRIAVRADAVDGEAVLLVRDTGIGIVAEMLSRVFELFVRTDGARAHAPDGMGIGLTLVRQLVALHGGRVVAHSEGPGQGAEFTVRLPLSVASEPSGCTAPALAD